MAKRIAHSAFAMIRSIGYDCLLGDRQICTRRLRAGGQLMLRLDGVHGDADPQQPLNRAE